MGGRLGQMEAEASVSLFRLRVQERQFEAFFASARERLRTAEALVLQSQHLWDPAGPPSFAYLPSLPTSFMEDRC